MPYEQSKMMEAELKKHGVKHELITVAGAEHGMPGGDPQAVEVAYRVAAEFLKEQLAQP